MSNEVNKLLEVLNGQDIQRIVIIDSDNSGYIKEFISRGEIENITTVLNSVSYHSVKKKNELSGGWSLSVRFITKDNSEYTFFIRGQYTDVTDNKGNDLMFSIENYNLIENLRKLIYNK